MWIFLFFFLGIASSALLITFVKDKVMLVFLMVVVISICTVIGLFVSLLMSQPPSYYLEWEKDAAGITLCWGIVIIIAAFALVSVFLIVRSGPVASDLGRKKSRVGNRHGPRA